jgi:hypothetical protein
MRERNVRGRLIALSLVAGIIITATTALAALPDQATASSGSIGVRLLDVPADSPDGSRGRSYIVERVAPGTTVRRRIEITNTTSSTADIAIYPAAADLRGTFRFASGHSRNELSSWTSVSQLVLRLAPGAGAVETVTIEVPKQASAGERYAVVWAEVSAPAPVTGGVTLVNRVGIRMYISVGPGGAPPSNFAISSLTAERSASGEPLVVATIHNSGQRTIDITGNLTLDKGPGGLRAGPFPVKLAPALGPGDSATVAVQLGKQLPRGPWRAHLRLRSGLIQHVGVATITFPPLAKPTTTKVVPAESSHLLLVVIVLLGLLALAALPLLLSRRARRSDSDFKPAPAATVRET